MNLTGRVLQNKYLVGKVLGRGQQACVYYGTEQDTSPVKEVAIKVINRSLLKPKERELLESEISVMSQLSSEHIVKLYDTFEMDLYRIFILEYCNEGTLSTLLEKNQNEIIDRIKQKIFKEIILAYKELHSKLVLHRDIKLQNILVHNGTLKLCDFGFSKQVTEQQSICDTLLGTRGTMAPELLEFKPYGIEAEIYSLGVVFYQISKGKFPYVAPSPHVLVKKIKEGDLDCVGLTDNLTDLLKRMLEYDIKKRIQWKDLLKHQFFDSDLTFFTSRLYDQDEEQEKEQNAEFYINLKIFLQKQNILVDPSSQSKLENDMEKTILDHNNKGNSSPILTSLISEQMDVEQNLLNQNNQNKGYFFDQNKNQNGDKVQYQIPQQIQQQNQQTQQQTLERFPAQNLPANTFNTTPSSNSSSNNTSQQNTAYQIPFSNFAQQPPSMFQNNNNFPFQNAQQFQPINLSNPSKQQQGQPNFQQNQFQWGAGNFNNNQQNAFVPFQKINVSPQVQNPPPIVNRFVLPEQNDPKFQLPQLQNQPPRFSIPDQNNQNIPRFSLPQGVVTDQSQDQIKLQRAQTEKIQQEKAECDALIQKFTTSQQNYSYMVMAVKKLISLSSVCYEKQVTFLVYVYPAVMVLIEKISLLRERLIQELNSNSYQILRQVNPKEFKSMEVQLDKDGNYLSSISFICELQYEETKSSQYDVFKNLIQNLIINKDRAGFEAAYYRKLRVILIDVLIDIATPEKIILERPHQSKLQNLNEKEIDTINRLIRDSGSYLTLSCLVEQRVVNIIQVEKLLLEGNYKLEIQKQLTDLVKDVDNSILIQDVEQEEEIQQKTFFENLKKSFGGQDNNNKGKEESYLHPIKAQFLRRLKKIL